MMTLYYKTFVIFICLFNVANLRSLNEGGESEVRPIEIMLSRLMDKVHSYQVLEEESYKPPFKWARKLGLYNSEIRLNFFGPPAFKNLRDSDVSSVFDNDMFSTGWILTALLEANLYGKGAPLIDHNRLQLALDAVADFNYKNEPNSEKTLIRTFWPQIFNESSGLWYQQPINIREVALDFAKFPFKKIACFLKLMRLKKLARIVEEIANEIDGFADVFNIPPDFDDTYLNLGLGATLSKLSAEYPEAAASWLPNNTDVARLVEVTCKYAYAPFNHDLNENVIDSRTFFYARKFIQDAEKNQQDVKLVSTWVQNLDEQRVLSQKKITMPFNVNNVDVTVAANAIYGMSAAFIHNVNGFGDEFAKSADMQQIYLNTTRFISWAINSNFSSRPDLALVYYPSRFNFLWYASRSLFLLDNEFQRFERRREEDAEFVERFERLQDVFAEAKRYLSEAFEQSATELLLSSALRQRKDAAYFCDFIGLNDTDVLGRHEASNDDCLFSTAQAVNILIATWTSQNADTKALHWKPQTPDAVKSLVNSSVNWLMENSLGNKFKPLNAFFSGSVKGFTSLPFVYPGNFAQYLNGSFIDPNDLNEDEMNSLIYGVKGSINEETYQKLLKQRHFGAFTPIDFAGYNVKDNIFPFWSSEPYTYAVTLLALSQFNNLT